jgi:hypothetical protein
MASRIVNLVRPHSASRRAPLGPLAGAAERAPTCEHVWQGASGRPYAHRVYGFIECPPLPAASYILVRRDEQGRRTALRVGVGTSDAPTLNLAQVRQLGAQVGANEVHVRLGATSDAERWLVACDLRASLFGALAADAGPGPAPVA